MDRGPGLLEPFLNQIWTLLKGVGRRTRGFFAHFETLYSCFCTFTIQGVTVFASTSKIDLPV